MGRELRLRNRRRAPRAGGRRGRSRLDTGAARRALAGKAPELGRRVGRGSALLHRRRVARQGRIDPVANGVGAARPARRRPRQRRRYSRCRLAGAYPAKRRRLGRGPLHRHRLSRRLLHQLRDVPRGVPAQRARPLPDRADGRVAVNDLLIVTALRTEYAALAGRVPGATVARCGMGPERVNAWLPRLAELSPKAVVVAGVAGGLDPTLRPGDVVVATEVRDERGRIVQRAAAPLVAELRRLGLRVRTGPMLSCDHIVRGAAARARLAATGAIAVDMESAAIVRAAPGVPTAVVRVIVDTAYRPMTSLNTATAGARALLTLHKMGPALRLWADLVGP